MAGAAWAIKRSSTRKTRRSDAPQPKSWESFVGQKSIFGKSLFFGNSQYFLLRGDGKSGFEAPLATNPHRKTKLTNLAYHIRPTRGLNSTLGPSIRLICIRCYRFLRLRMNRFGLSSRAPLWGLRPARLGWPRLGMTLLCIAQMSLGIHDQNSVVMRPPLSRLDWFVPGVTHFCLYKSSPPGQTKSMDVWRALPVRPNRLICKGSSMWTPGTSFVWKSNQIETFLAMKFTSPYVFISDIEEFV